MILTSIPEIDAEVGRLSNDLEAAQNFRADTLRYMQHCLGLSREDCPTPENQIIAFFKVIGDAVLEFYTFGTHKSRNTRPILIVLEQRELLLKELEFFMETSEVEQRRRLSDDLPTMDEYITCRMGTSAVGVTSAFNECVEASSEMYLILTVTDTRKVWHLCRRM